VGGQDIFVRVYDFDGDVIQTVQTGVAEDDRAPSIAVSDAGAFVGGFTGGAWPGHSSSGADDALVVGIEGVVVPFDPCPRLEDRLKAIDEANNDAFGSSVSIDGDVALIGAINDGDFSQSGAAYVYRFNGSVWVEEQKLKPLGLGNADQFGWCEW
jgi:hypothetical protein